MPSEAKPSETGDRKYAVFISYRHADNKEQGRQWATWLHHTLETYEVPPDLEGRTNLRGEPVPASLYPVFRDEEELPADADLSANIQRALRHSALLVVLCSPRAVESRFVADEIRVFKELGKAGHILALMIDGEPNATDDPGKARAGIRPEDECLPEPLRYGVPRADGSIDWKQRTEPIAADVRPENKPVQGWTTAAAYREELTRQGISKPEIDRLSSAYEEQLQLATMKIIAGAIGLPLGEVTQRDKRHAEEKLKRARQELSRTEFLFARQLLDLAERETGAAQLEFRAKAHARLSRSLEKDSTNRAAAVLGLEQVRRAGNRGALRHFRGDAMCFGGAVFSPCGYFVLFCSTTEVYICDAASGLPLISPLRHEDQITTAVFSPDGARILTVGSGAARLWDATKGVSVTELLSLDCRIDVAIFSPDGTRILTTSYEEADEQTPEEAERKTSIRLWDAITGESLIEPLLHNGEVAAPVFSPCGTLILTVSEGRISRLWGTASSRLQAEHILYDDEIGTVGTKRKITTAVFSPDGTRILTASNDHKACIWDVTSGTLLAAPLRHDAAVRCAVFSPDGARILTASSDRTARLWDAINGAPLAPPLRHDHEVISAVFSPDGNLALTGSADRTARLWDTTSGALLTTPLYHPGMVGSVVFSPDGARVLTNYYEDKGRCISAYLWDVVSSHPLAEPLRHKSDVRFASFDHDGSRVLTACYRSAGLWSTASGEPLAKLTVDDDGGILSAGFVADEPQIHTASYADDYSGRNIVRIWDLLSKGLITELRHKRYVLSSVLSADGTRIFTTTDDGTTHLWEATTGANLRRIGEITSKVVSSDGRFVLTESFDGKSSVWDSVAVAHGAGEGIVSEAFSLDGKRVVTISEDHTVSLWDADTRALLTELLTKGDWITNAVFSPDGARILTRDYSSARVWDAGSGTPLTEPIFHGNRKITSAAFSPEGARILTTSEDQSAVLWDAESAVPLAAPLRHDDTVNRAVFSADGVRILTASKDKTVRLWDTDCGELSKADSNHVCHLLEAIGGCHLNEHGKQERVTPSDIDALRHEFDANREMHRLLRWWWSDPFTRTINPSSAITVPDYVRRRIREILDLEDEKAKPRCLQDARDAFLNHPLVLLCEAEQGKCGDPAWLRQHAVSRLLAEPHYLTPLEPPNAIGDAKANRQYELTLGLAEDCFLGARLLLNDRTGQTRTTDPKRLELAKQVLARAMKLAPKNEAYRKLAVELDG